jgi:polysaccharide export outer membrane protein
MKSFHRLSAAIAVTATIGATALAAPTFAGEANKALPPPHELGMAPATAAYRIGPSDKLDVTVFQVKDLTGPVVVDAGGDISLPLVGSIKAGGRTPTDVAHEIASRLKDGYVQDPQVTVSVKEALSQKVTVEGAVLKPGVYPITGPTTLSTAVALAEGADPKRADEHKIRLIRVVDGQRLQASYDLVGIRKGKVSDPEVYGNDIVVVDDSAGRGLFNNLVQMGPLFYLFTVF